MKPAPRDIWTFFLVLTLIAFSAWFGALGKPTEMGIAIVGVSIALAFVNLERLESFKGAGFEAKMRKVVDEAYATLDLVRRVAKATVITNIDMITYSGRLGGPSIPDKVEQVAAASAICDTLGILDKEMLDRVGTFFRMLTWDYVDRVNYAVRQSTGMGSAGADAVGLEVRRDTTQYPEPQRMRDAVKGLTHQKAEHVEETIRDYEYFLQHHKAREGSESRRPR